MTIELDRRKMLQLLGVGAGSMPITQINRTDERKPCAQFICSPRRSLLLATIYYISYKTRNWETAAPARGQCTAMIGNRIFRA